MTITEAAKQGITKLRLPQWRMPTDHVELYVVDGRSGPWMKFYSDLNQIVGNDNPMTLSTIMDDTDKWVQYKESE